jgi:hypothetical protein
MDRSVPPASRLRSGRLVLLSLLVVIAVGACGSSSAAAGDGSSGGDGGGAGEAEVAKIIAASQFTIGTSMVSGELQGDTIVITMVDGFGAGGSGLFMCSNLKIIREKNDPSGSLKMVMVNQSGVELANSAACK